MGVIREAVEKCSRAPGYRINDFLTGDHGAERSVSAGESLGSNKNVRLHVPMFDCEITSGTTHTRHHFIGNQEHAVAAAHFGDGLQISWRWNDGTQRRAADGLKDECSRPSVAGFDGTIEFGCVLLPAVAAAVTAIKIATVAVGYADVCELPHHRQIDLPAALVAGNGQRAESRAVIALLATKNLVTFRLSDFDLILARQFQRSLDRFRAAASEVNWRLRRKCSPAKVSNSCAYSSATGVVNWLV